MLQQPGQHTVNLYLVGFMGTGKTTVGRALAQRLRMQFVDVDAEVERLAGMQIAEIFEREGEAAFRRRERDVVVAGHAPSGCIVSCGGGLIMQPGMVGELRKRGVVICLTASAETIIQRTANNRNRPLLNVDDPAARIREMLMRREPLYREAGTQVLTDHRPLPEIVAHVQRVYLREAREFALPRG
ncbi:shikimate kinase [Opitutales bacterium ASA1]|uniref:shikimate kinase n=1 Tax=Congregicoccus parvus TaxID=3081749 RepID=UPI002B31CB32|nr:shikimate kinase [Opitutales bacterium ASA1]